MDVIIHSYSYGPIFHSFILVMCLLAALQVYGIPNGRLLRGTPAQPVEAFVLVVVLVLFIGLRPIVISEGGFGDSYGYAHTFDRIAEDSVKYVGNHRMVSEYVWMYLAVFCADIGLTHTGYFVVVAALQLGIAFCALRLLFKNNVFVALVFVIAGFEYYNGLVNGIRNHLGNQFVILGLAMTIIRSRVTGGGMAFLSFKDKSLWGILLCFLAAYYTHHSDGLPIMCLLVSVLFFKDIKVALSVWGICLVISMVAPHYFEPVFEDLGFDDRLTRYITYGQNSKWAAKTFSRVGFRWDFLCFSMAPIVFAFILRFKKNVRDQGFILLVNTYLLANAFWLLVMRAGYSNRFAALSWFIYSLVFAYPLLELDVFKRQSKVAAYVLICLGAFSCGMYFLRN